MLWGSSCMLWGRAACFGVHLDSLGLIDVTVDAWSRTLSPKVNCWPPAAVVSPIEEPKHLTRSHPGPFPALAAMNPSHCLHSQSEPILAGQLLQIRHWSEAARNYLKYAYVGACSFHNAITMQTDGCIPFLTPPSPCALS